MSNLEQKNGNPHTNEARSQFNRKVNRLEYMGKTKKNQETLKSEFSQWIEGQGFGFGKVMMPLRLALVGALEGADVFDIIHCIGKAETIFRIKTLIDKA